MKPPMKKSLKPPPKKVHYSLSQHRPICGTLDATTITPFRSHVTCRACKRVLRRLPASSASLIPVKYTLVAIGLKGPKTVYIDTTEEEAIRRYRKKNGDTPKTRAEINRTQVLQISDQFWATQVWPQAPGRKPQRNTAPEDQETPNS